MKIVIRQWHGKAVKKPPFWGLCAVILALFSACPPYLPENVQIKTEPAIYLPLGTPDSVQKELNAFYDDFTKARPSFSEDGLALYDFHNEEEYGDAQVFIAKVDLVNINLGALLSFPDLPDDIPIPDIPDDIPDIPIPGVPDGIPDLPIDPVVPNIPDIPNDITIDFTEAGFPITDTQSGFDLSEIQNILGSYAGIKFQSIPVYLYVSGPNLIFADESVTISVKILDGENPETLLPNSDLLLNASVKPLEFPDFPDSEDTPMTALSPRPETSFDLADILNMDNPSAKLDFEYTIEIKPITIDYKELKDIKNDFQNTPLSVMLVVVLPLQFKVTKDVPILSEKNTEPDAKAIHLLEDGEDLFGRVSEDDEGDDSMKDIFEMLRSLRIDINIENNIGLAGYVPVYRGKPNPEDEEENLMGEISLSGLSSISLSKPEIAYPFNIWIEMYLRKDQDFEIKRPKEEPDAPPPLKLSLAVIVQTHIDKTL